MYDKEDFIHIVTFLAELHKDLEDKEHLIYTAALLAK